jgi:SAM-dependent methyltransferase
VAETVALDNATAASAAAWARQGSLELVDIVPANLRTVPALDFLRTVDPAAWRTDVLAPGRGGGQAMVASRQLLDRAAIDPAEGLPTGDLVELGARLKQYALRAADIAVAPGVRAATHGPDRRAAYLRASGVPVPLAVAMSMTVYGLLVAAVILQPWWGVAALAVYSLQPWLIFAGGPLSPPDLGWATALRVLKEPLVWLATVAGGRPQSSAETTDRQRADRSRYAADLRDGTARFFEPRRSTCPWCGSDALRGVVVTGDRFQKKPGRFTLEECRSCGHVFQNPRLSLEGLEFYYRDFYDGFGAPAADWVFRTGASSYHQRAAMLRGHGVPGRWLDVGAGHAHFCVVAHDLWPDTSFDGLDMGEAIEDAEHKGWVGRGYRGQFVELADDLVGRYDVVSMHHYLEHTREPRAELDAAARVVSPGGLLLIEVPDPEWRLGRRLGRFWVPWLQPQHQHLVPIGALKLALVDRGFTPVAEHRAAAHQNNDFTGAAFLVMAALLPDVRSPWSTRRPTIGRRLQAAGAVLVGVPLITAGIAVDLVMKPIVRRGTKGNAYRILARKQ